MANEEQIAAKNLKIETLKFDVVEMEEKIATHVAIAKDLSEQRETQEKKMKYVMNGINLLSSDNFLISQVNEVYDIIEKEI